MNQAAVKPKKKKKGFIDDQKALDHVADAGADDRLLFIFNYIPMAGVYRRSDFSFKGGLFGSPGWDAELPDAVDSGRIAYLTRNTILYNVAFIFLNFCQIAAAIILSRMEDNHGTRLTRLVMFLPASSLTSSSRRFPTPSSIPAPAW